MSVSASLKSCALDLESAAENLNGYISGEVSGGRWRDRVGESYADYASRMLRTAENLKAVCDGISSAERNLNSFDADKDARTVSALRAEVKRI